MAWSPNKNSEENRSTLSGIYCYLSCFIREKLPLQSPVRILGVLHSSPIRKVLGEDNTTILLANDFVCAWKTYLEGQGRGADFQGCENLLKHHRTHVIFIWSVASCRAPIGEAHCCTGVEPTVLTFWNAALDSLAVLLSDWLTLADGERQACDGPALARKAVHLRASWPAWPLLGDDDATHLTRYVVLEEDLQSAWKAAGALPPDALVPRRESNVGTRMSDAVRYAV